MQRNPRVFLLNCLKIRVSGMHLAILFVESTLNILVTGGAGYIGSHVSKRLSARGYLPIAYDNLSRGQRAAVKWGPLEVGDIDDRDRLRAVLGHHRPIAVMHFAALAYVSESVEKGALEPRPTMLMGRPVLEVCRCGRPLLYYKNNVAGSIALLETLNEFGALPFIFSSSCITYGIPDTIPISEDHPQHPINPYGHSKLFVERMLFVHPHLLLPRNGRGRQSAGVRAEQGRERLGEVACGNALQVEDSRLFERRA